MADGGMTTGAVITRKTLSSTFLAMDMMVLRAACRRIVHQLLLIFHHLPGSLPVSLSVRLVIAEVS